MLVKYKIKFAILATFLFISYSCGPKIYFFEVEEETVSSEDSIRVTWDVRGEPTLLIHQKVAPDDSTLKLLELTLVVQKGSDEVKMFRQINVRDKYGSIEITFVSNLREDTLIASGENDTTKWGKLFQVISIASNSGRPLTVIHSGKSAELDKVGTFSTVFNETPLEGYWEIRSILTDDEKENLESVPDDLSLIVKYQYKRR